MGLGDNIMATGMAKGAAARGKRIAFGDRHKIIWDPHSPVVFRGNPNIVHPGQEGMGDIEWIPFFKGFRQYNRANWEKGRWDWNMEFRPIPGEIFFDPPELEEARHRGEGYILVEPNVPEWKECAPNKQWGIDKWTELARKLVYERTDVRQLSFGGRYSLPCQQIGTKNFRQAMAALSRASLFIGPEGGMHHAAAALGIPAVVIFGGFIPPRVTGYDFHINIAGSDGFCGSFKACTHCKRAMNSITVEQVLEAVDKCLNETNTKPQFSKTS